ncbi:MAG: peptidoglycan-binding protein, partial [Robiginitomaculum sp.]|nr:peptidoglycan-binding protein [Robiginitomaculum sp.]
LTNADFWYTIAGLQGEKIAKQRSEAIEPELSADNLDLAQARIKAFSPTPVNNVANGVFNDLPWVQTKPETKSGTEARVKTVQKMLTSLGYNVGKPDGAMGPNTRNAIISFERANGLPETGRANAALIARLQLAAGA